MNELNSREMEYAALVTGANRGIGLGLVEQLASKPDIDIVFAATRNPKASALQQLNHQFNEKVIPVAMEVVDPASVPVIFSRAVKPDHSGSDEASRRHLRRKRPRYPHQQRGYQPEILWTHRENIWAI